MQQSRNEDAGTPSVAQPPPPCGQEIAARYLLTMPDVENAPDSFCEMALVFDVLRQREVEQVSMPVLQGWDGVRFGAGRYYDGFRVEVSRRRMKSIAQQVHAQLAILTGDLPSSDEMSPRLRGTDLHLARIARPLLLNGAARLNNQIPLGCKGAMRFRVTARRVEWLVSSPRGGAVLFQGCVTVE
jgi:hypothetical protein